MFGLGKKKRDIYQTITDALIACLRKELFERTARKQPLNQSFTMTFQCPPDITEEDMKKWYKDVYDQVDYMNESSINIFGIKM